MFSLLYNMTTALKRVLLCTTQPLKLSQQPSQHMLYTRPTTACCCCCCCLCHHLPFSVCARMSTHVSAPPCSHVCCLLHASVLVLCSVSVYVVCCMRMYVLSSNYSNSSLYLGDVGAKRSGVIPTPPASLSARICRASEFTSMCISPSSRASFSCIERATSLRGEPYGDLLTPRCGDCGG